MESLRLVLRRAANRVKQAPASRGTGFRRDEAHRRAATVRHR